MHAALFLKGAESEIISGIIVFKFDCTCMQVVNISPLLKLQLMYMYFVAAVKVQLVL